MILKKQHFLEAFLITMHINANQPRLLFVFAWASKLATSPAYCKFNFIHIKPVAVIKVCQALASSQIMLFGKILLSRGVLRSVARFSISTLPRSGNKGFRVKAKAALISVRRSFEPPGNPFIFMVRFSTHAQLDLSYWHDNLT